MPKSFRGKLIRPQYNVGHFTKGPLTVVVHVLYSTPVVHVHTG